MGQTTNQIEHDIENKRENLRSNFRELESKVRTATDWRHYYEKNTGAALAVAAGAGVLISMLSRTRTTPSSPSTITAPSSQGTPRQASRVADEALEAWNTTKSALVGVAASQIHSLLGRLVPGFNEQVKKVAPLRSKASSPMPQAD